MKQKDNYDYKKVIITTGLNERKNKFMAPIEKFLVRHSPFKENTTIIPLLIFNFSFSQNYPFPKS